MADSYENYIKLMGLPPIKQEVDRPSNKYRQKLNYLRQLIREYAHENAAIVDEIEEVQIDIIIRSEERKLLLKKLCEYEPQVAAEVQSAAAIKAGAHSLVPSQQSASSSSHQHRGPNEHKKSRKRSAPNTNDSLDKKSRPRRPAAGGKSRKKFVPTIPLDSVGRPIFPINININLNIHSLGDIIFDRIEFHTDHVLYPIGFKSIRIYGSLENPTEKCTYSCEVSEVNGLPHFTIYEAKNESIDKDQNQLIPKQEFLPIEGDTPDVCHALLLQRINDALSLNVVSTRPRGNDFFGLSHPTVLNLLQGFPSCKKCTNFKFNKYEIARPGIGGAGNAENVEESDAALSFEQLQKSINICKFKMSGPDLVSIN